MSILKEVFPWKWYKISTIIIDEDDIRAGVDEDTKEYYPFDYYESDKCICKGCHSIFEDFISIKINDNNSITEFVEKYGFLTFNASEGSFYIEYETGKRLPHSESLKDFTNEYLRCKQLADLYELYNTDNLENLLFMIKEINPEFLQPISNIRRETILCHATDKLWIQKNLKLYYMSIITFEINYQTKSVSYKLVINKDLEFDKDWSAPDLLRIIYQMFSLKISSGKILRRCQSTYCDTNFFLYKNDKKKKFCSPECASRQSSFRYREKHKDEINAKKRAYRASNK